jgi:hypothetical protein
VRPGGEKRGNSRDRRRRKGWLLATFDTDLGPDTARCHLRLSSMCARTVTKATITADRITPGGTYARHNIRPACRVCQNTQGALITKERRDQWRSWWDEAQAAGIEWDGVM